MWRILGSHLIPCDLSAWSSIPPTAPIFEAEAFHNFICSSCHQNDLSLTALVHVYIMWFFWEMEVEQRHNSRQLLEEGNKILVEIPCSRRIFKLFPRVIASLCPCVKPKQQLPSDCSFCLFWFLSLKWSLNSKPKPKNELLKSSSSNL